MSIREEIQFAYRIRRTLDKGVDDLDPAIRDRLQHARSAALGRQKTTVAGFGVAGMGQFAWRIVLPHTRTLAALAALILAVVGHYYWHHYRAAADNVAIDSALLADDLPINAYLDHGFSAWLAQPSSLPPR